jgi:hypothetical protein
MKYFNYLLFVLFISACGTTEEAPSCFDGTYDQEMVLRNGDSVCFEDGNSFEIKTITDEFCCCFCDCFWEGELRVMVETTDAEGEKALFTFGSSTYNGLDEIFNGYVISDFYYLYEDEPDSLPLCEGEYDSFSTEVIFVISEK